MRTLQKWDDEKFISALNDTVQRKAPSDLDGAHMRILFASWRSTLLPSFTPCAERELLEKILHHWCEVRF